MDSREQVDFLASSPTRLCLLRKLRDQSLDPSTLTARCTCSRATVHRNLETVQQYGWVRSVDGSYELTVVGKRILDQFDSLLETISTVNAHKMFFQHLGDLGLDIPLAGFDSGTVVTATPENPHAPLRYYTTEIAELSSKRFYGISPIVSPEFNEAGRSFVESGTEIELIIDETVLSVAQAAYPNDIAEAFEVDHFSLYVYPDDLTFGLALFDDRVFVGSHTDNGQLQACLDSTDEELFDWVADRYNQFRAEAEPVERDSDRA
ncbi:helix-turn-helix transcriptional regulator [Haladaptatus halobius]|uniref:helix-turn-helix transcriptional regulator n=1 Tax=Haladaptatus halobius TaxID=2884875 RepID=UPI001D0A33B5|nr:transcriptional regulator [Haladaptatus halobius]